ncbi:unnamed protein product [Dibothriocephalus latus]|uniref:Cytochrome b561 domain-containing protein n=1 Tax=Dibothriocephalus latus TaxID=60516 RepID=A0A3P7PA02_DIBLA|nr:unnamed protein product [Dibothriocephalus latus]
MLIYRVFPRCSKLVLKALHAALLLSSLVIGAVGLRAAYSPLHGQPYSLHSWLGIIVFTLYGLQVLDHFVPRNLLFFFSEKREKSPCR